MLLVDHDQAEVLELHLVLDQGVGADRDPGVPAGHVEQRLPPGRHAHRPGEQRHPGAQVRAPEQSALGEVAHHLDDRPVVLLGQHLGGREQHRLPTRVGHGQHGPQRHEGLPGADLALEQPVHGVVGRQVGGDLGGDLLLALGEGERQPGVEGVQQAVGARHPRLGGQGGVGGPAPGEGDLEDEGLVPAEPVLGALAVGLAQRAVDQFERLGQRDQAVPVAEFGGQRLADVGHVLGERRLHAERELPAGHLGAGRVDRDHSAGESGGGTVAVRVVEQLVVRGGQLAGPVEHPDLAREQALGARSQLLLPPALVEEDQREPAAAVGDHHLQPVALAAAERDQGDLVDPGQHSDVLVDLQLVQTGELAPLDVAARIVVQQVPDRAQLETVGEHLGGPVADELGQWFIESAHQAPVYTTGPTVRPAHRPVARPVRVFTRLR